MGKKGQGPLEFVGIGTDFTMSNGKLSCTESSKKEIKSVMVTDILQNGDSARVESTPYPYKRDFRPFRFTIVGNKRLFLGGFAEGRLGMTDATGRIIPTVTDYPFDCGEVEGIYRGATFQGNIKGCEKQKKFVISTFSSDVFETYSVEGDNVQRTYVSSYHYPPQVMKKRGMFTIDTDKSIGGLLKMSTNDEFIHFTYSSKSYKETSLTDNASDEILCFDWNGKKIKKISASFSHKHFLC